MIESLDAELAAGSGGSAGGSSKASPRTAPGLVVGASEAGGMGGIGGGAGAAGADAVHASGDGRRMHPFATPRFSPHTSPMAIFGITPVMRIARAKPVGCNSRSTVFW
jgi:hypothetical protein